MISYWIASSMERVFKRSRPRTNRYLRLDLGRRDKASFQVCVRNSTEESLAVNVVVNSDVFDVGVRRVGYVPCAHISTGHRDDDIDALGYVPGFIPDPLFFEVETTLARNETESFWISLKSPEDCPLGLHRISVILQVSNDASYTVEADVFVHPVTLEKRRDFPVTHWCCTDALCDWYGVEPFDDSFWRIVRPYITDLVEHGTNVCHTPLFTPPTDGVKRPTQLLRVRRSTDGSYEFDWRDVKRWVDLAKNCGMEYLEWTHLFSQWGANYGIRIYENYDGQYEERLLWPEDTQADSQVYTEFLAEFLPRFKGFLDAEGLMNRSYFHLSDEPQLEHLSNYKRAREILRVLAPWMKVMDALSQPDFTELGLTDIPVASISTSKDFYEKGIPRWDYFCCQPRGRFLNRFVDTPLAKIRGAGWLFYRFESLGFLHWGYNYWYKHGTTELIDPYRVFDGELWPILPNGDPFVVYPGANGPVGSLRWEVFAESLNDYTLLQTLRLRSDDSSLSFFKAYDDYPQDRSWYELTRAALLFGKGE
ncbi:MAG: DUF4091 domain-containing protein [Limnochordia bacterium]|jgi:hypothetical protein|nr:DUF4091 domain-containing protein [Limnochordia bacterium]MDD4518310.1 DUF4091 domain-containing protein [Limnochordia bacterium]